MVSHRLLSVKKMELETRTSLMEPLVKLAEQKLYCKGSGVSRSHSRIEKE